MSEQEFRKFDSADKYRQAGVRLTKDAETRDGAHGPMVRLTATSESRKEQHSTLWLEINVGDWHAEAARFLLKGDILHLVEGKPCLRRYGDDNEKWSFVVDRAELTIGGALFNELKDRGFVPGAKGAKPAPGKAGGKKPAVATKPAAKGKVAQKVSPKKPVPVEIPDDEDLEIEEDSEDE